MNLISTELLERLPCGTFVGVEEFSRGGGIRTVLVWVGSVDTGLELTYWDLETFEQVDLVQGQGRSVYPNHSPEERVLRKKLAELLPRAQTGDKEALDEWRATRKQLRELHKAETRKI